MEKLFQLILVVSIVTFCKCNFSFCTILTRLDPNLTDYLTGITR